jgi:transcriptional regulator with XRE-family HTH domain
MTLPSTHQDAENLASRDRADYGFARLRDQMFDAVTALWRRRKAEGLTQKELAARIGRDPAWVSRNLAAPGNWTLRTAGELIQALDGEADINVGAREDYREASSKFAYTADEAAARGVGNDDRKRQFQ